MALPFEESQPLTSLKVLIVDDCADAANCMALLVKSQGHVVRTAADGDAAIQAAIEFLPHLLLLDIGLPKVDGYEVAKRLRQHPDLGRLAIVAVSGYGEARDIELSHQSRIDHHLMKPADFDQIEKILASVSSLR
jgi:CheY-like chemotaxis protein